MKIKLKILNSKIFLNLKFSDENFKSERNPEDNKILLKNLQQETVYINKDIKVENHRIDTETNLLKK